MKLTKLLSIAALLACFSLNANAENLPAPTGPEFVSEAASTDMFEIKAANLMLDRSDSGDVKKLAREIIKDHTKSSASLKAAIKKSKSPYNLPDEMNSKHTGLYDDLKSANWREFDRVYIRQQRALHADLINTYTAYAASGDDKQLRAYAEKTLPLLRKHKKHIGTF